MACTLQPGLRAADFFCGGGGMSCGLKRAGISIVAALDNDPQCQETYEANHPGVKFLSEDVKKLPVKEFGEMTGIGRNDDGMIFVGCSPCQYWSVITGKAKMESERKQKSRESRNLLRDFLSFVKFYHPGFVVVENVRGIERTPEESGLSCLLDFFDANGYGVSKAVLACADFGVPQTRRRFVLVASRVLPDIGLPKPGRKRPTVRDVIGALPKIKAGETDPKDALHRAPSLSEANIARLRMTREGGTRDSWMHSDLQIDAYRNKPLQFFRDNYGRMWWDAPAPTITTKFFALGSGRFGHPEQNRALSLREGALLQTFPKSYKFKTNVFAPTARIIGNAVPPEFARRLGASIVAQVRRA